MKHLILKSIGDVVVSIGYIRISTIHIFNMKRVLTFKLALATLNLYSVVVIYCSQFILVTACCYSCSTK